MILTLAARYSIRSARFYLYIHKCSLRCVETNGSDQLLMSASGFRGARGSHVRWISREWVSREMVHHQWCASGCLYSILISGGSHVPAFDKSVNQINPEYSSTLFKSTNQVSKQRRTKHMPATSNKQHSVVGPYNLKKITIRCPKRLFICACPRAEPSLLVLHRLAAQWVVPKPSCKSLKGVHVGGRASACKTLDRHQYWAA